MTKPEANIPRAIAIIAVLAVGSFFVSVRISLPDGNLTFSALQNFSHFLLFAFLGWAVLYLVYGLLNSHFLKAVVVAGIGLCLLGLAVELYQMGLASRDASLADFALDVAGMVVGFLTFSLLHFWRQGSKSKAVFAAVATGVIFLIAVKPVIPLVGFDILRPAVPVVRSFGHLFSESKIESNGGAHYSRQIVDHEHGCCVLRMVFSPALYSGVVFHEQGGSWSKYEELSIKIFSSLPNTRQIELRINDGLHNNLFEDRYNGSFAISPGLNELRVPLVLIAMMGNAELSGREMDIDDVTRIQFFISEIESSFALDLLSVELL